MNKLHKRFIAMLVIFTSLISFLPMKFGEQVAKAATAGTDIEVTTESSTTPLTPAVDSSTQETIYTTAGIKKEFNITVSDVRTTEEALTQLAKNTKTSQSGIINQEIEILSINGIQGDGVGTDSNPNFSTIGVEISDYANPVSANEKRVGVTISNLPYGVNKIVYKVKTTTLTMNCDVTTDSAGNSVANVTKGSEVESDYKNGQLTIEHATTYAVSKINPMVFNAYIGSQDISNESTIDNNTRPFLYSTTATPDSKMQLRYTFDVPDSVSTLTYDMTFDSSLILDGAKVYKNGAYDSSVTITNNSNNGGNGKLHGSLSKVGDSDIILLKLDSSISNGDASIQKVYSIEIRYNTLESSKDYSIKNAGITKLNYNDSTDVKAYIGKKFTVGTISSADTTPVYNGTITIDKRARMISIDPTLVRNKSTVTYQVTNKYVDSSGNTNTKSSELKNGKQYIDFSTGSVSNTLQVDVYEGDGESITGKLLVRYLLAVSNSDTTDSFNMNLIFDDGRALLTQPGVKANTLPFSGSRRTYDLYTGDEVKVALGEQSSKNEYIKVWLADEVDGTLTEADESKNNEFNATSGLRDDTLNITVGTAKEMVVQAYYDEYTNSTTGSCVLTGSYPVGDKYYFYLPNNFTSNNNNNNNNTDKSSDALLSLLKIKDATLIDSNGNKGFSSDTTSYNVTVAKDDTSVKLTATSEDENVQSIVATVDNSEDTYGLVSGEATELPLNSSGTTNIKIVVTAQDGSTAKTYNLVINNSTKSSNNSLKNVILSTGDYTFDSSEDTTKVRVDQSTTSIKVTPVAEDSSSTITVNGEDFSSTAITVSLKGSQTTYIDIAVESEDGKSKKIYTLEVVRSDSQDYNSSDDGSDEEDQFYDNINQCWVDYTKYDEWAKVDGKPVYFDKKHKQVKDQWVQTKGDWYYLNSSGYIASGWKIDTGTGKSYYLDPSTGKLKTGWINLNNTWYYMGTNGVMHKGWLYLNGKWYYFAPNGQMVVNQSMYIDGKMYKFAVDGSVIS